MGDDDFKLRASIDFRPIYIKYGRKVLCRTNSSDEGICEELNCPDSWGGYGLAYEDFKSIYLLGYKDGRRVRKK